MDYQTFARILQSEGMTDELDILALWSSREDRELSEDRLRLTARHVRELMPECFQRKELNMKVLVITERGEDFAIAAIQLPEGKTEEEAFCAWVRAGCKGGHCGYKTANKTNEQILEDNTEYAFTTLTVQELA